MSQSFTKPVTSPISQKFGANAAWYQQNVGQRGHNGIDYAAPVGTPVRAVADGVVVFEGWGQNLGLAGRVAGIYILVRHSKHFSGYAHLSRTIVDRGQKVRKGQLIGFTGNTGLTNGPHLHFEMLPIEYNTKNGYYGRINPSKFLYPPKVVYKKATVMRLTNVRKTPRLNGAIVRKARKGEVLKYTKIIKGAMVDQNGTRTNNWLKLASGNTVWRGNMKI